MSYSEETINSARLLYTLGASIEDVQKELKLPNRRVVYQWAKRFDWDGSIDVSSLKVKYCRRLNWLIEKPFAEKSKADLSEELHIGDMLIKMEKADAWKNGESLAESTPGRKPGQKNGTGKKKSKKKNDVSHLTPADLQAVEDKVFFPHQKIWLKAGEDPATFRRRFILKSRQIGATYTFAWEAFKTAIIKGHDQIFISSTKAQAEQFKAYIALIAQEHFDIELTGNPTKLNTEHGVVQIHYLSPNSFANSRSGDVYFDEVFYTRSFEKMEKVAKPMATFKQYKQTYFGAPTSVSHQAYEVWSGKRFMKHKPKVKIDVSDHQAMINGRLDPDGFWRCVCTLDSAMEMGWTHADKEQLQLDTPDPELFANIYDCKFIDDSHSVFKLSDLLACGVDTLSWYPDFDRDNPERPAGDSPMSLGYDPAGIGDNAAICLLSSPQSVEQKFRLYEKQRYRGMIASFQAQKIVNICQRFNVEYMDIDKTGPGLYIPGEVDEALREAGLNVPRMNAVQYNVDLKARMVQKALNVIGRRRFEYDEDDKELPLAFMSIRQSTTEKTNQITYYATRTEEAGHADEAMACMHGFMVEPFNPRSLTGGGSVAFSD